MITGTVLLTFAASWALLATLSMLWTDQPQRWAAMPAGFMALAGAALLVFAPNGEVIDALGWVWPPLLLALLAATVVRVHRDLHSRTRVWVVYPLLGVYALCAFGGGYQTVRESLDRRMHRRPANWSMSADTGFICAALDSGTPTVILESGLGETARVLGMDFDRGRTRHEGVRRTTARVEAGAIRLSVPQDGVAVATDLHILLDRAHVPGPFVLVGHSSGAQYVRIFAGRYPEQVAGMVLLDGQPAEAFESLPVFPMLLQRVPPHLCAVAVAGSTWRRTSWSTTPALTACPHKPATCSVFTYSSARAARSLRDEFAELPTSLAQARSFQSLGDRPLVVVTAALDAQAGWLPLQDKMATLSTNSSHRVVPYTHDALVTDQTAAQTSIQAIRDVVHAVRFTRAFGQIVVTQSSRSCSCCHTLSESSSRSALHCLPGGWDSIAIERSIRRC